MRTRRAALVLSALLFTGCAARNSAEPTYENFGLTNFYKVSDDVYRSGQPSKEQLAQLVEHYGIKSVIKLNAGEEPESCPLVDAPRISGWSVVSKGSAPTTKQLKQILDAIDCAPKPVLIHCLHGEDRTGLIVALWRIRHGAGVDEAYSDMMRRGFHVKYPGIWKAWLRETGWDRGRTHATPSGLLLTKAACPSDTVAAQPPIAAPSAETAAAEASAVAAQASTLASTAAPAQ